MPLRIPFLRSRKTAMPFEAWLAQVREHARVFQNASVDQLRRVASGIRESLAMSCESDDQTEQWRDEVLATSFALSIESLRRTLGVVMYDVQLRAARALARGRVAEMETGEGKTLTALPAAVSQGLTGQGVHVITTNSYLAKRDFEQLRPAYELLGVSVGLLPEQADPSDKVAAYQCDVTYGTGYEFGFDYLRDQLALRQQSRRALGEGVLASLRGKQIDQPVVTQRSRAFAIVDEIDNVMLDDASSPLVLSESQQADAPDAEAHLAARRLALTLESGVHYQVGIGDTEIELTALGRERVYDASNPIPVRLLRRAWTEYVEQALRAELQLRRDIHYVVQEGAAWIVDTSTGRIFADRTWRDGLHQAIEAKEGLRITAEKNSLAQVTRQRFFRLYTKLSGMTGTATGCEREFETVYGLKIEPIPRRFPSRRLILPLRSFANYESKMAAMLEDIAKIHSSGRPILIGTRTIYESERLADKLRRHGLSFQMLNGVQDDDEAQVVSQAGQRGAITVSTNMAGRGTDIRLSKDVESLGGLHVIVAEPHDSARVDRQLVGRCARQSDPGSAQAYVSAEDALILKHGAWLIRPMRRAANSQGEVEADLSGRIARIQRFAERASYAARAALLRSDLAQDTLLARTRSQI